MLPDSYNELLWFFIERDQILFILFSVAVPLVGYLFWQLKTYERFFAENKTNRAQFTNWLITSSGPKVGKK